MKVCDRAYVTEDEEEESMSEHSYSPGTSTLVLMGLLTAVPGRNQLLMFLTLEL